MVESVNTMNNPTLVTLPGKLPNFIIIGAMRSGTTSLTHYLRAHPQVFLSPVKEIHFFDEQFDKGVEWYSTHFVDVQNEIAVGEATPIYMYCEEVPTRMASLLPDARLIAVLRNPMDRAYSHYWHSRSRGKETLSFEDALAVEEQRLATEDHVAISAHSYLSRGRYLEQLMHFCAYYPKTSLYVVLFEDLRDHPQETYASICRFLGVDTNYVPDNLGAVVNEAVTFRSLAVRKLAKRLQRYAATSPIGKVMDRLNTARHFSYPPINSETRAKVLSRLTDENAALAEWLGRDLSVWNQ